MKMFLPLSRFAAAAVALIFASTPSVSVSLDMFCLAPTRAGIPVKEKLETGDRFEFVSQVNETTLLRYAQFSEDHNWPHLNKELAAKLFKGVVAHGMLTSSLSLDALAVELDRKIRTAYHVVQEETGMFKPVFVGDAIRYEASVEQAATETGTVIVIKGWKGDVQVLEQTIHLAESRKAASSEASGGSISTRVSLRQLLPSVDLKELKPTERVSPPVYLAGETRRYEWEMTSQKAGELAALFKSPRFSDAKTAKAVLTYVAQAMFPSSLFVKARITEMRRDIPVDGKLIITARVVEYGREGKKRGRSLTEISVKDEDERLFFRGEIDMKAFPYTKEELVELSKSKDRDRNLAAVIRGKNQPDLEMIFSAILKPELSGVEFVDEYHAAIEQDPGKTLERAKEEISKVGLKVAVVGVGGIGGGVAESLAQIPGVQLTVLTRDDAGYRRIAEKLAAAKVENFHEVRIKDSDDMDSYVRAVFEAKEKMGGLDVLFIGTGMAHAKDTLLPKEKTPDGVIEHLKDAPRKINWVNQQIVDAAFTAAAACDAKNIFVVGSVHGQHVGNDWVVAYARSKAANDKLAEAWPDFTTSRKGAMGISLQGDYILSQMTAGVAMAVLGGTQLGFFMTPKQVAEAATWLIVFHDHEQLGYTKEDKKKGGLVPDVGKARSSGAHQVAVPGKRSVGLIKGREAAAKAPKAEAPKPAAVAATASPATAAATSGAPRTKLFDLDGAGFPVELVDPPRLVKVLEVAI